MKTLAMVTDEIHSFEDARQAALWSEAINTIFKNSGLEIIGRSQKNFERSEQVALVATKRTRQLMVLNGMNKCRQITYQLK